MYNAKEEAIAGTSTATIAPTLARAGARGGDCE